MKLLELTGINRFDNEVDCLVALALSQEEKDRIAEKHPDWNNAIASAIVHVWVSDGVITGMDLSVFDGLGGWEDGILVDTVLSQEAAEDIYSYVREQFRQATDEEDMER